MDRRLEREVIEIYHQYGASKKGGNGGGQKGFVNDESKCMDSIGEDIGDESNSIKLVTVTANFARELMTNRGIERLTAGKREEIVCSSSSISGNICSLFRLEWISSL